ncbi:MAG TPA: glucokinase [Burkholderiaceae bacterium]|nr:glucokinase [Burkholderiaceae bacterium]
MSTGTPDHLPFLVADIGGTRTRFALCTAAGIVDRISVTATADFPSIEHAIRHYLHDQGNPAIAGAVIGIATPIIGDHIQMTNSSWSFAISRTREALGLGFLHVINDFTALALSVPLLQAHELQKVGGGDVVGHTPVGLIGPGTGLGVSALIPVGDGRWVPLAAEGGHVSFAPGDEREQMLWTVAHRQHGHVSMERLLSGAGLQFMYDAFCRDQGVTPRAYTPIDITSNALAGKDDLCNLAVDTFCAILGTAASDLAVTLGARGGIYIGGGIVPKLGDYFTQSPFRRRFEDKGRFSSYLALIPVFVITSPYPALLGAAAYPALLGATAAPGQPEPLTSSP